jgi:hypothetical protein
MSLINQVYGSLKWKKTDLHCAAKIGIPLLKYQEIKSQILQTKNLLQQEIDNNLVDIVGKRMLQAIDDEIIKNQYITALEDQLVSVLSKETTKIIETEEDLEGGTGKIKAISSYEPKSPEDVEELVKIKDSTKWKLSHYYNKQQPNGLWLITAMVALKKLEPKDYITETLKNFKPSYIPVDKVHINDIWTNNTIGVLSIQDLHFGKEGNDTIVDDFKKAIHYLVNKSYFSYKVDKLIYVIGGDLLNMDTFMGQTTKGNFVDSDLRAQDAYNVAFDALYWSVNYIKQFCNELTVVYLPGNHDRLSSYHLAHGLSKCFPKDSNIIFDVEYSERKVVTYGKNFFAFEHGDVTKKMTPLVYATEFPVEWGATTYRTCYTGHFHTKKVTDFVTDNEIHGFSIKHLPSLSKTDYWHYHNKFTGSKRQAIIEIHDIDCGKVSEFIYTA